MPYLLLSAVLCNEYLHRALFRPDPKSGVRGAGYNEVIVRRYAHALHGRIMAYQLAGLVEVQHIHNFDGAIVRCGEQLLRPAVERQLVDGVLTDINGAELCNHADVPHLDHSICILLYSKSIAETFK